MEGVVRNTMWHFVFLLLIWHLVAEYNHLMTFSDTYPKRSPKEGTNIKLNLLQNLLCHSISLMGKSMGAIEYSDLHKNKLCQHMMFVSNYKNHICSIFKITSTMQHSSKYHTGLPETIFFSTWYYLKTTNGKNKNLSIFLVPSMTVSGFLIFDTKDSFLLIFHVTSFPII